MNVNVANASGNDYDAEVPSGYDSWIDYWNKSRYPNNDRHAGWCRNCRKNTEDLDGGHVELCKKHTDGQWYFNKSNGVFITPLCAECNNPSNTKLFSVDTDDLIKVT